MRAENEVKRIVPQPVLPEAHLRAQAPELMTKEARLIEETQRVDVSAGLDDAKVDRRCEHGRGNRKA
ncbi:hypothetical protein [Paraburkholderia sp. J94]|uniref:hypothetical protein n=1 Tax=Paraburkholderia sp. J94 TaxID=2805441 RepID=UPI002AB1895F|nr:hypothetical protein [Paraburkholderia sp. J94]